MKERISIRQMAFLFIFVSITPILSYIPKISATYGKNNGYLCAIYYAVILCIYTALILQIAKKYPKKSFYEIIASITGSIIARIILFCYGVWALLYLIYKVSSYSLLLKTTLLPDTESYITIAALFMLVIYAMLKGTKTVFRVAEFLYGPILFILVVLFFFAFTNINKEYLVPISPEQIKTSVQGIPSMAAVGGNLCILLFFIRSITKNNSYPVIKIRLTQAVIAFTLFSVLSITLAIGISGASLTSKYTYSIFQTVKCISLFQTFERFDSIITILCMFSDFVTISIFLLVTMKCFAVALGIHKYREIGILLFTISCVLVIIKDISLFEMENMYRIYMDRISLVFQYVIPVILGVISLFKKDPQSIQSEEEPAED